MSDSLKKISGAGFPACLFVLTLLLVLLLVLVLVTWRSQKQRSLNGFYSSAQSQPRVSEAPPWAGIYLFQGNPEGFYTCTAMGCTHGAR